MQVKLPNGGGKPSGNEGQYLARERDQNDVQEYRDCAEPDSDGERRACDAAGFRDGRDDDARRCFPGNSLPAGTWTDSKRLRTVLTRTRFRKYLLSGKAEFILIGKIHEIYLGTEEGMKLDEIFEHSSDAVFAIDDARQIVYRNEAFAELFRYASVAPLHHRCYEVVCGKSLDGQTFCNPDCPIGKSLAGGHAVPSFDLVISPADGNPVWVSVGSSPLPKTFHRAVAVFLMRPVNVMRALGRLARGEPKKEEEAAHRLTPRERQILKLLAEGHGTRESADILHISHVTARNHIRNIFEKLDVHSRAEAVSYVYRNGLLDRA